MLSKLLALFLSFFTVTMPHPVPARNFSYPIGNYTTRQQLRTFGQYVTAADQHTVPCGAPFVGYHTGVDLETTPAEASIPVPVYSILDGKIVEVSHVSGYGGLIVVSYIINSQPVTAYYGHISLQSAVVKAGDAVTIGERLADLGKACSAETDGERKHLHFALHQGTAIDLRGYVQTREELNSWLDPASLLSLLQKR